MSTPLNLICEYIDDVEYAIEIVKILIRSGADIDNKDKHGMTPLMYTCKHGYVEIVKVLIQAGADINVKTWYGWTSLIYARRYGHKEIMEILIETNDKK